MARPVMRRLNVEDWRRLVARDVSSPARGPEDGLTGLTRSLREALSDILGIDVKIVLSRQTPQIASNETMPVLAALYSVDGAKNALAFGMAPPSARTLLDIALGGAADQDIAAAPESMGRSERKLVSLLFDQIVSALPQAFERQDRAVPVFVRQDAELAESWAMADVSNGCLIQCDMPAGRANLLATLCMPQSLLAEPEDLNRRPELADAASAWRDAITKRVAAIPIFLEAMLVDDDVSLADVEAMLGGDSLHLRLTPVSDVLLSIQGRGLLRCRLGQDGGMFSLRIVGSNGETEAVA